MVDSNNSELIREVQNATKIQTINGVPRSISNQIVPVIEVNPKVVKEAKYSTASLSNSTGTTFFTTPTNQDVYLCSAHIAVIKDAGNTSTNSSLTSTVNGLNLSFLSVPHLTTTAQSISSSIVFPHPIKLDRGVTIRINTGVGDANIRAYGTVSYFVDDGSNG